VIINAIPFFTKTIEKYSEDIKKRNLNELIPKKQLTVFQGVTANNIPVKSIEYENDEMKPSVDGSSDGPRSLFMFAYNKVSPECCLGERSGGYSTNGGCVCITDKQKQYYSENSKSLDLLDKCIFP
jgi:hypothetical protein